LILARGFDEDIRIARNGHQADNTQYSNNSKAPGIGHRYPLNTGEFSLGIIRVLILIFQITLKAFKTFFNDYVEL